MNKIQYDFVKCPACGNKIFLDDIDACHPNGIVWEEDEHGKKYLFRTQKKIRSGLSIAKSALRKHKETLFLKLLINGRIKNFM
jgi:hypothetical protein